MAALETKRGLSRRVMWVLFLVAVIAFLSTALLLSFVAGRETFRGYREDLASLAQVLATNCQASLAFGLSDDAERLLMGLKARSSIVSAAVLDEKGRVFATYGHVPGQVSLLRSFMDHLPSVRLVHNHLYVAYPVELEGKLVGAVVLEDDLAGLSRMFHRLVGVVSLLFLALLALFFLLSRGFQRLITSPILQLAQVAQEVAQTSDYSLRIPWRREDELGILVSSFNGMMEQIERKEAELRRSEQRFQAVFNQSFQFVAVASLDGDLTDVNDTIQAFCGRGRDSLLDLPLAKAPWWSGDPQEMERVEAAVKGAAAGEWTRFEAVWKGWDGTSIQVDCSFKPVVDPDDGSNLYIIMEARDITPMKRVQEALRVSELRFRELFNSSLDAILVVEGGRVTDANKAAFRLLGDSPLELVGRRLEELVAPGEEGPADGIAGACARAMAGEPQTFEGVVEQRGLGRRWVEVRIHQVSLDHGDTLQVTLRDITEKKEYEMELNRLASAVRHAAEAMVILDREGRILYSNPAFSTISGYEREEVLGERPRYLTEALTGGSIFGDIWEQINRGQVWMGRLVCHRKDGGKAQCDATLSPILSSSSRIAGFVAILRDITRQLQMEEKMRQTQKLEAIGTLAGGIAHDFNNILASIFGNTELALDSLDQPEKVKELLHRLLKSAGRARDLVQQILTFSRQKEGKPRPVAIQTLVKETLKLIRSTLPATIQLQIRMDCDAMVLCDPVHIHQVVMNLCTNAAQAMAPSGGVLTVELEKVRREKGPGEEAEYVCLTVSDTGIGIPPENLERIFDPFFTTKEEGEGTGLGLSIVHSIVQAAGGDITVESEPGRGSTFRVYLPVTRERGQEGGGPEEEAAPARGAGRILFVDDEEMIRRICQEMLGSLGYEVVTAADGREALELLQREPGSYDLVITDLSMPRMDGLALAKAVKELEPSLPVVLSTGYMASKRHAEAHQGVVDGFLQKPYRSAEMAAVIRRFLK